MLGLDKQQSNIKEARAEWKNRGSWFRKRGEEPPKLHPYQVMESDRDAIEEIEFWRQMVGLEELQAEVLEAVLNIEG